MSNFEQMTMDELAKLYKNLPKNHVVLDIRTPEEFAEGHVPGAINIDHEEVLGHVEALKKYEKVYVHCRSGGRVRRTLPSLKQAGLSNLVSIDTTGMLHWEEKGYEIEK